MVNTELWVDDDNESWRVMAGYGISSELLLNVAQFFLAQANSFLPDARAARVRALLNPTK